MDKTKLSPSDFAYLWEECKHCYYLKVKFGIYQPSMPMPGVFSAINTRIQTNLIGKNLKTIAKDLPDGVVESQEGWVESTTVPGTNVFIKGKYDLLVKNPDGTHTLIDLKISQPGDDKIEKYRTQLSAYKFALENPVSEKPIKLSKMALLIFYPDAVSVTGEVTSLTFPHTFLEVSADDEGFVKFIASISNFLTGPIPPESTTCKWCIYRNTHRKINTPVKTADIPF